MFDKGSKLAADAILDIDCDIWIPAARPDVVRADNVSRLRTRLMPQGANIPCTPKAERALHERGVLVIPDFIANAGGVICASVEYRGGTQRSAFDYIDENILTILMRNFAPTCARSWKRAGATRRFRAPQRSRWPSAG